MNSHKAFSDFMSKGKDPEDRPLPGRSTRALANPDGSFSVRYHDTDVICFYPDGRIVLDSGGYNTPTTKARINEYLPRGFCLYQEKGVWYLRVGGWQSGQTFVFADGMTINTVDNTVTGAADKSVADEQAKLGKAIRAYAKRYIAALCAGKADLEDEEEVADKPVAEIVAGKVYPFDLILAALDSADYVAPAMLWAVNDAYRGELTHNLSSYFSWTGTNLLVGYLRKEAGLPHSGWS